MSSFILDGALVVRTLSDRITKALHMTFALVCRSHFPRNYTLEDLTVGLPPQPCHWCAKPLKQGPESITIVACTPEEYVGAPVTVPKLVPLKNMYWEGNDLIMTGIDGQRVRYKDAYFKALSVSYEGDSVAIEEASELTPDLPKDEPSAPATSTPTLDDIKAVHALLDSLPPILAKKGELVIHEQLGVTYFLDAASGRALVAMPNDVYQEILQYNAPRPPCSRCHGSGVYPYQEAGLTRLCDRCGGTMKEPVT